MTDLKDEWLLARLNPTRMRPNSHYVIVFGVALVVGYFLNGLLTVLLGFSIPGSNFILTLVAAVISSKQFIKNETRHLDKDERKKIGRICFLLCVVVNFLFLGFIFFVAKDSLVQISQVYPEVPLAVWIGVGLFIYLFILIFQYLAIHLGFSKYRTLKPTNQKTKNQPLFPQNGSSNAVSQWSNDDASNNTTSNITQSTAAPTNNSSDWNPPSDGFAVREEQAPWLKYTVGVLALFLVAGGGIWLASKVVIADKVPVIERADKPAKDPKPQAPKSADDLAWVQALETDTVEGYRAYLAAFPNGRHIEDAQRLLNEFDEEAWVLADERDTIEGYENYLESWPEGLHATEARDRIAKMKAEEEARRKNAEEAARQEAAAWKTAAQANTIPSYEGYLAKFPTGKNASEAQTRIARLRAEAARQQASAADEAAWNAANATATAGAYQQYLTSFPQGAHVPEAIAKLEELRPGPGKTFKDCATCPTMVTLPSGTTELGAQATDGKAKPNEKPARPVTFTDVYAIGVTEVTFAEYGACVSAGGCKSMPSDNGWGQGSRPVINVSWSDAVAYAQWLSNTTGKRYGLPSGAQWEYAARGGKTDALIGGSPKAVCAFANGASKESELPWANTLCTDLAADRTLPAGSLSKNAYGVADMIGNVSEWVLDCNTLNLRDAPVDGSADARGSCSQRIVRGGSWFSGPDDLRYSARAVQRRGDTNDFTGFRVVRN